MGRAMNIPDFERDKLDTALTKALQLVQDSIRWYPLPPDVQSSLAVVVDEIRYSRNSLGLT